MVAVARTGAADSTAVDLMVVGARIAGVAVDSTLVGADTAVERVWVAGFQPDRGKRVAARIRDPVGLPLARTAIPASSEAAGPARIARGAQTTARLEGGRAALLEEHLRRAHGRLV
jgi:hypothetical protein